MLKSATIGFHLAYQRWNVHRQRLAWVIGDGMHIGDGWLGLSVTESSYRWQNAQIDDGWVSFGLSTMECSSTTVAWVIGDGMLIDDGWLGLSAMKCTSAMVGFLGYRLQVMMKTAWECLVFRLLGVK